MTKPATDNDQQQAALLLQQISAKVKEQQNLSRQIKEIFQQMAALEEDERSLRRRLREVHTMPMKLT
jgi:cell division protein FtsB